MSLKCFFIIIIIWYYAINHELKSGALLWRQCKRGTKSRIKLARVSRRGRRAGGENPDTQAKLNNTFQYAILFTIITTHLEHNKAEMHWTLIAALAKIQSHCYKTHLAVICGHCDDNETLRFLPQLRLWMSLHTETVLIYRKSTAGNSLGAATRLISTFEREALLSHWSLRVNVLDQWGRDWSKSKLSRLSPNRSLSHWHEARAKSWRKV